MKTSKIKWVSFFLIFITFGCKPKKQALENIASMNSTERVIWVDGLLRPCTGVAPMFCLAYKENLADSQWHLLYDGIKGFEPERGYLYQIRVNVEHIPQDQVPADGSSIEYHWIETLATIKDTTKPGAKNIYSKWVLSHVKNVAVAANVKAPWLEILEDDNVKGNDGCNLMSGRITAITENEITFSPMMTTRKACPGAELINGFAGQLNGTMGYEIKSDSLHLYNEPKERIFTFSRAN